MAENITTDAIFVISDGDVADTDVETAAPGKKKKRLQKFKESYAQEYAWVTKSKKGQFHAHCTYCTRDISIGCGGLSDLKSHSTSQAHKSNATAVKKNQVLSNFYLPKKDGIEKSNVRAAEVAIAYHTVKHSLSYNSMDCSNKLSKLLFCESSTAKQMQLERTKAEAIITSVLASESVQQIRKDLDVSTDISPHKCLPYSISSDTSNKGNIKMFPLIVQYFSPNTGVNVKLLDFYEDPQETSDDIMRQIQARLNKHSLPLESVSAYSADNASINFGNCHSVFTLIKEQCPHIVKAGCKAHVIHNAIKHAANKMENVDIEILVIRVYNHFSSHAKRTLALKEMFEFVDLEWSQLLRHVPTRWLSLEPAVRRLEANWAAVYSYFQSIDDCPVAIQRLMKVDRDGAGEQASVVRC